MNAEYTFDFQDLLSKTFSNDDFASLNDNDRGLYIKGFTNQYLTNKGIDDDENKSYFSDLAEKELMGYKHRNNIPRFIPSLEEVAQTGGGIPKFDPSKSVDENAELMDKWKESTFEKFKTTRPAEKEDINIFLNDLVNENIRKGVGADTNIFVDKLDRAVEGFAKPFTDLVAPEWSSRVWAKNFAENPESDEGLMGQLAGGFGQKMSQMAIGAALTATGNPEVVPVVFAGLYGAQYMRQGFEEEWKRSGDLDKAWGNAVWQAPTALLDTFSDAFLFRGATKTARGFAKEFAQAVGDEAKRKVLAKALPTMSREVGKQFLSEGIVGGMGAEWASGVGSYYATGNEGYLRTTQQILESGLVEGALGGLFGGVIHKMSSPRIRAQLSTDIFAINYGQVKQEEILQALKDKNYNRVIELTKNQVTDDASIDEALKNVDALRGGTTNKEGEFVPPNKKQQKDIKEGKSPYATNFAVSGETWKDLNSESFTINSIINKLENKENRTEQENKDLESLKKRSEYLRSVLSSIREGTFKTHDAWTAVANSEDDAFYFSEDGIKRERRTGVHEVVMENGETLDNSGATHTIYVDPKASKKSFNQTLYDLQARFGKENVIIQRSGDKIRFAVNDNGKTKIIHSDGKPYEFKFYSNPRKGLIPLMFDDQLKDGKNLVSVQIGKPVDKIKTLPSNFDIINDDGESVTVKSRKNGKEVVLTGERADIAREIAKKKEQKNETKEEVAKTGPVSVEQVQPINEQTKGQAQEGVTQQESQSEEVTPIASDAFEKLNQEQKAYNETISYHQEIVNNPDSTPEQVARSKNILERLTNENNYSNPVEEEVQGQKEKVAGRLSPDATLKEALNRKAIYDNKVGTIIKSEDGTRYVFKPDNGSSELELSGNDDSTLKEAGISTNFPNPQTNRIQNYLPLDLHQFIDGLEDHVITILSKLEENGTKIFAKTNEELQNLNISEENKRWLKNAKNFAFEFQGNIYFIKDNLAGLDYAKFNRVMTHEAIHIASDVIKKESPELYNSAKHEILNDKNIIEFMNKEYPSFDKLSDEVKVAETIRAIVEGRFNGRTSGIAQGSKLHQFLTKFLNYIKDLFSTSKNKATQIIILNTEEFLGISKDSQKSKDARNALSDYNKFIETKELPKTRERLRNIARILKLPVRGDVAELADRISKLNIDESINNIEEEIDSINPTQEKTDLIKSFANAVNSILEVKSYGYRTETAKGKSYVIRWSNGAGKWVISYAGNYRDDIPSLPKNFSYWSNEDRNAWNNSEEGKKRHKLSNRNYVEKGGIVKLDSNEILITPEKSVGIKDIEKMLDYLPPSELFKFSHEQNPVLGSFGKLSPNDAVFKNININTSEFFKSEEAIPYLDKYIDSISDNNIKFTQEGINEEEYKKLNLVGHYGAWMDSMGSMTKVQGTSNDFPHWNAARKILKLNDEIGEISAYNKMYDKGYISLRRYSDRITVDGKQLSQSQIKILKKIGEQHNRKVIWENSTIAKGRNIIVYSPTFSEPKFTQETNDNIEKRIALAHGQRGIPESTMLKVVKEGNKNGSPAIINTLLEHFGDLSDRASRTNAIVNVHEKLTMDSANTLFDYPNRWNSEKEINEGFRSNAEYMVLQKHPEIRDAKFEKNYERYEKLRSEYKDEIDKQEEINRKALIPLLDEYIKAHKEHNNPINRIGKLGKNIAIKFAEYAKSVTEKNPDRRTKLLMLRSDIREALDWVDNYYKDKTKTSVEKLAEGVTDIKPTQERSFIDDGIAQYKKLGWNYEKWGIIPQDLANKSVLEAVLNDPSLTNDEKEIIKSFVPGGKNYSIVNNLNINQTQIKPTQESKSDDVIEIYSTDGMSAKRAENINKIIEIRKKKLEAQLTPDEKSAWKALRGIKRLAYLSDDALNDYANLVTDFANTRRNVEQPGTNRIPIEEVLNKVADLTNAGIEAEYKFLQEKFPELLGDKQFSDFENQIDLVHDFIKQDMDNPNSINIKKIDERRENWLSDIEELRSLIIDNYDEVKSMAMKRVDDIQFQETDNKFIIKGIELSRDTLNDFREIFNDYFDHILTMPTDDLSNKDIRKLYYSLMGAVYDGHMLNMQDFVSSDTMSLLMEDVPVLDLFRSTGSAERFSKSSSWSTKLRSIAGEQGYETLNKLTARFRQAILRAEQFNQEVLVPYQKEKIENAQSLSGKTYNNLDLQYMGIYSIGRQVAYNEDVITSLRKNMEYLLKSTRSYDESSNPGLREASSRYNIFINNLFDGVFDSENPLQKLEENASKLGVDEGMKQYVGDVVDFFKFFEPMSEFTKEFIYGREFKGFHNYIPIMVMNLTAENGQPMQMDVGELRFDQTDEDISKLNVNTTGLSSTFDRTRTLRPGQAIVFNINHMFANRGRLNILDYFTSVSRREMSALLKPGTEANKALSEFLKDERNQHFRMQILNESIHTIWNNEIAAVQYIHEWQRVVNDMSSRWAGTVLSSAYQFAAQSVSNLLPYVFVNITNPSKLTNIFKAYDYILKYKFGKLSTEQMALMDKLMLDLKHRHQDAVMDTSVSLDIYNSSWQKLKSSSWFQTVRDIDKVRGKLQFLQFQWADMFSGLPMMLAEYTSNEEKRLGRTLRFEELVYNPASYFRSIDESERFIGIGNKSRRGEWLTNRKAHWTILRHLLTGFASHRINNATNAFIEMRKIANPELSTSERAKSLAYLSAIGVQSASFSYMKLFVVQMLMSAISSVFKDDKDEDEAYKELIKQRELTSDANEKKVLDIEIAKRKQIRATWNSIKQKTDSPYLMNVNLAKDVLSNIFVMPNYAEPLTNVAIWQVGDKMEHDQFYKIKKYNLDKLKTQLKNAKNWGNYDEVAEITAKIKDLESLEALHVTMANHSLIPYDGMYGGAIKNAANVVTAFQDKYILGSREMSATDFFSMLAFIGYGQGDISRVARVLTDINRAEKSAQEKLHPAQ